ncbi:hypothetical protein L2E82_42912 [Cichorium intybus]|uniref:Uncharacterized protein n=1 Tax=Cichorium intybus TaxID=13427 RepID=A0ACB8ZLX4_CICIN|nr:hypothetical protein L2E82_42912 [Cichorium intybus]
MGPHEPYWRTNTSFSPPPPRWDFRFHSEAQSFRSEEGNRLYISSTSSNSRESRNWSRTNHIPNHRHSNSDGIGPVFSSPSDLSPNQQWTPPTIQEINLHDYSNSEGIPVSHEGRASISSHSDSSDFETIVKSLSSHHGRRCFMSKPVHPLSIPVERTNPGIHDSDASCDFDFSDVSEPMESDPNRSSSGDKCGLCERFLSQRSPWSSRQIIRSGDFPVTGVLSCRHVFHAECLDQTTPKTQKGDPPCPVCVKSENNKNCTETRVLSKSKNGVPRLKPFREDGPSRPWGCVQAGNCVEGALSAPSRNGMLVINRNRIKKGLSLKGKEFAGKLKHGGGDGSGSSSRKKS